MTILCAAAAALAAFLALAPFSAKAVVYSVDIDFVADFSTFGPVSGNISGTFEYLGGGTYGSINLLLSGTGATAVGGAPIDGLYDAPRRSAGAFNLSMVRSSLGPDFTGDPRLFILFPRVSTVPRR